MARKALTDEQKYKYIADNAEVFIERRKKNVETLDGYENLKGEELDKVYKIVQGSIRRANEKANNATKKVDIVNASVPLTPLQTIQNVLSGYLVKRDIAYVEWKEIKEFLEDCLVAIEGKMKETAKEELNKAIEEREELNKIIAELEEKAK